MNVYPSLVERIKAVFIDTIVLIGLMLLCSTIFSTLGSVSNEVRIGAFIFIFFLYDPSFTSLFGGTIGHMIVGLRVKRSNNRDKNIHFPAALIRFACKTLLGWISLLTVSSHEEKNALHDSIVGSIVIYG